MLYMRMLRVAKMDREVRRKVRRAAWKNALAVCRRAESEFPAGLVGFAFGGSVFGSRYQRIETP